ncbi:MAG: hypothetical protein IJM44_08505 [Ruminococcus sp.]|nr:hypothetical protein [Ruminococcus sp.]
MASEAVKKILAAETESDRLMAEARQRRDDIVSEAEGSSSLAIQKKITEATAAAGKIRAGYADKAKEYAGEAEKKCSQQLAEIQRLAEKNMDSAADAIISEFF